MKSQLLFIACLFFSVLITGCSSEQKENYLTRNKIKGDVKSLISKSYDVTTKLGEIEKESIIQWYQDAYNSDGSIDKDTYEYDENGNKVDVSFNGKETYEYNEEGNVVEMTFYNSDGSVNSKITNEYDEEGDEEGNWTHRIIFNDGVATSLVEREFEYYD